MLFIINKEPGIMQKLDQYQCFEKTLLIITKSKKANAY